MNHIILTKTLFYDTIYSYILEDNTVDLLLQSFQARTMSWYEAGMLICFGASWPVAVSKTFRTKNVKGKSRLFLALIMLGYVCGIINKLLYSLDIVIWLYIANLALVSADFFLVLLYKQKYKDINV